jgi:hypothetical protein
MYVSLSLSTPHSLTNLAVSSNICLTLLGYFPGHIHAFYLIYKKMQAEERYGAAGYTYLGNGNYGEHAHGRPAAGEFCVGSVGCVADLIECVRSSTELRDCVGDDLLRSCDKGWRSRRVVELFEILVCVSYVGVGTVLPRSMAVGL